LLVLVLPGPIPDRGVRLAVRRHPDGTVKRIRFTGSGYR